LLVMSLPTFMQKGLTAFLKVVNFASQEGVLKLVNTLSEHFTLTTYEIAQAYQHSYVMALEAISMGLGKPALLASSVVKEFAQQISTHYLPPFAFAYGLQNPMVLQQFCEQVRAQCQELAQAKDELFKGDCQWLSETELATLINDNGALSITQLLLEQLSKLTATHGQLDDRVRSFFSFNDLLGQALLFFLQEQLRQEPRVERTLAMLQRQGLWQDVKELKTSLDHLMTRFDLSAQIKPRDEFTVHNHDSLVRVRETVSRLQQLPANHPDYSRLSILGSSVLSSTGALTEAETLLLKASAATHGQTEQALVAFNLFQVRIRERAFDSALTALQQAIAIDRSRYALHDVEKYPLQRILGIGGMGCVFLCRHQLRKQPVVVKCFWQPRQGLAEEVFKEAFTMSEIASEYVPAPLDYGYVDPINQQRAFFVTEYIDGAIDGETWLEQQGKLEVATGIDVGLHIARGLQAAHAVGVLHLDLKPANLLLKLLAPHQIAIKIIDFGLAQVSRPWSALPLTQASLTKLSSFGQAVFGTLDYAPPEQQGGEKYGKPSAKSDVFALGATLYRLLTNDSPRKLNPRRLAGANELFELLCECMEDHPQLRPTIDEIITRLTQLTQYHGSPLVLVPKLATKLPLSPVMPPVVEKSVVAAPSEYDEELQQLLELARQKYENRPYLSIALPFTEMTAGGGTETEEDIYVVCPRCDKVFTVSIEGQANCPHCCGEFEIDEDGDVIYEYEEE